jgi:hypothetical protein
MKFSGINSKINYNALISQNVTPAEEDARYVIFDIFQPFYTKLCGLFLRKNDIKSMQSLGTAAKI